jgi:hypothetical protein
MWLSLRLRWRSSGLDLRACSSSEASAWSAIADALACVRKRCRRTGAREGRAVFVVGVSRRWFAPG